MHSDRDTQLPSGASRRRHRNQVLASLAAGRVTTLHAPRARVDLLPVAVGDAAHHEAVDGRERWRLDAWHTQGKRGGA